MILPEKHITLAESLLGLGAFVLGDLRRPKTVDQIYARVVSAREDGTLPAFHSFDDVVLSIVFLYSVGAVDLADGGRVQRCV